MISVPLCRSWAFPSMAQPFTPFHARKRDVAQKRDIRTPTRDISVKSRFRMLMSCFCTLCHAFVPYVTLSYMFHAFASYFSISSVSVFSRSALHQSLQHNVCHTRSSQQEFCTKSSYKQKHHTVKENSQRSKQEDIKRTRL